ncbi:MAG: metal ABC transporter substrate-binding protein [Endomicrobium sp.]|jgi:zinc transport system substrate-binding protein|nr:metal ABC transporter substrate-binding protein [Endomicrobium sp.]
MKRLIMAVPLILLFVFCQAGAADKKISVITTNFSAFDFVREIAKDKVELVQLLPLGAETHSFEPTPKDIVKIKKCEIFIYAGGESDVWVDKILSSIDVKNKQIIPMIKLVDAVEEEIVEGMQEEEEEKEESGEEEVEYDEHVWTSPKNAKIIAKALSQALIKADPKNAEFYRQNTDAYIEKLDVLDKQFEEIVKNSKRKTIVFADRFPFRYFADAYGLKYFAAFPGCSTETEASAGTVKFLIDKVKAEKIPVVFHIEMSNEKMADVISEATGAKKRLFHACHNVSKKDFKDGLGYIDFMTRNAEVLKEALN